MSVVIVVGAQWGDEGKGKITDYLAKSADYIVRYQGGSNAGHTIIVGEEIFKFHLIPSGILYPDKVCVIGNGVVIDPEIFLDELDILIGRNIPLANIRVSTRSVLVMPYHRILDAVQEARSQYKVGTTGRGIGPAYTDKVARKAVRVGDLFLENEFKPRLQEIVEEKNLLLKMVYQHEGISFNDIWEKCMYYRERLLPYIEDTSRLINDAIDRGKKILFEGAQGSLLDIDHGTYPYVTSSNSTAGGACIGAGIGPTRVDRVLGITKAYTTRVGEGPFPTELLDETGELLGRRGQEFGTTTGRPRRCGWFDAVVVKYAAQVNGLTDLAVTKLDVLDELESIKINVAYRYNGQIITGFPESVEVLKKCEPVYMELKGWMTDTSKARSLGDLPPEALEFVNKIEELSGVKVSIVAVGPERNETILINDVFAAN